MPRAPVACLLVLLVALASPVAAQSADVPAGEAAEHFFLGGEPGVITLELDGADLRDARDVRSAVRLDPAAPSRITMTLAPPENTTWAIRTFRIVALVGAVGGPIERTEHANVTIPPGYTVVMNRTIDLAAVERVGGGVFRLRAIVEDADGAALYDETFHVRIDAGGVFTAQGAAITVLTVASGYGLWRVLSDLKEFRDAWDRHRKRLARAKLDVIGAVEDGLVDAVAKRGKPLAAAASVHRDIDHVEKRFGPVRWTATGLGIGAVGLSWLQYLGYAVFDLADTLAAALETAALFLGAALLAGVLTRRWRARAAAAQAAAEAARPRRIPVVDVGAGRLAEEPGEAPLEPKA